MFTNLLNTPRIIVVIDVNMYVLPSILFLANNPYGIYRGYKIYDAFVMSVQSDDGFLKIFVERLEQASLSLLVPERDLLPESAVYDTWAYAIQCR